MLSGFFSQMMMQRSLELSGFLLEYRSSRTGPTPIPIGVDLVTRYGYVVRPTVQPSLHRLSLVSQEA